jgi:hypothetical protein
MRYDAERGKYVVRWRENGRRRVARYDTPEEAEAHERRLGATPALPGTPSREVAALAARVAELEAQLAIALTDTEAPGDGVFSYKTKGGTRYGFKFRQSDGTSSTRRGYLSRRAARGAKRALEESIRRGEVKVARESFEAFWHRFLTDRKPYLTRGTYQNYEIQGRKRLLPYQVTPDIPDRRRATKHKESGPSLDSSLARRECPRICVGVSELELHVYEDHSPQER